MNCDPIRPRPMPPTMSTRLGRDLPPPFVPPWFEDPWHVPVGDDVPRIMGAGGQWR